MARDSVKKARLRHRSNSNEKSVDPIQELDRIEKHLSKSICELDEMHRNLRVVSNQSVSRQVSEEIDMREADALINDLIEELNIDRDIDNRLKSLEIEEKLTPESEVPQLLQPDALENKDEITQDSKK
jgi:hypothetical protein